MGCLMTSPRWKEDTLGYFGCENKKKWNHHRLVIQCSQAIIFKDVQPMSLSVVSKAHSPVESHQAEAEVEDP